MMPVRIQQFFSRHLVDMVLVVLVFSFYLPAMTQDFLYLDDHGVFSKSLEGRLDPVDNYYLRDGRPLTGMALVTAVNSFDSFAGFRLLRAFSLITTVCLGLYLRYLLTGIGIGKLPSALIALATVTTPSMAVYVGWATCFLYPASAFMSLASGQLVRNMAIANTRPGRRLWLGSLAVGLLVMALSIYQISAIFFLIPLMLQLSKPAEEPGSRESPEIKAIVRQVAPFCIAAGMGLMLYLTTVSFLKAQLLSEDMMFGQRSNFRLPDVAGWQAHARAMISMVIPSWFHFLGIPAQVVIVFLSIGTVCYACAGTWLHQKEHPGSRDWFTWLLLLCIAVAPMVVLVFVDQPTTPWRLYSGTSGVLLIWLTLLMYRSPRSGVFKKGQRAACLLFMALLVGNVAIGSYVFRAGFVSPNVKETQLADELWGIHDPNGCSLLILVAPKWYELETPGTFEYGFRASGLTGLFPKHAFRSFYANTHGRAALGEGLQFIVLHARLPADIPSGICVYTLQDVAGDRYRVDPMDISPPVWHKTFGPVVQLHEGVLYSDAFGYFFETAWDWYFNPVLGRIMVVPENNSVETLDTDAAENQKAGELNTDWIWSENLDKWIQLRDLQDPEFDQ